MTIKELIEELQCYEEDEEVGITIDGKSRLVKSGYGRNVNYY